MSTAAVFRPTSPGTVARIEAHRTKAEGAIHPVETYVLKTLGKAGGWTAEHIGPAKWRLNGVEIDRLLLVTIGFHVRTGKPLPEQWLALVRGTARAA